MKTLVLIRLSLSKSANLKPQIIDLKSIDAIKDESPLLVKYLNDLAVDKTNVLKKYVTLIKNYAITVGGPLGLYLLLEICATSPYGVTKVLVDDIEWIKVHSKKKTKTIFFLKFTLFEICLRDL